MLFRIFSLFFFLFPFISAAELVLVQEGQEKKEEQISSPSPETITEEKTAQTNEPTPSEEEPLLPPEETAISDLAIVPGETSDDSSVEVVEATKENPLVTPEIAAVNPDEAEPNGPSAEEGYGVVQLKNGGAILEIIKSTTVPLEDSKIEKRTPGSIASPSEESSNISESQENENPSMETLDSFSDNPEANN